MSGRQKVTQPRKNRGDNFLIIFSVYIETGRQANAGNININVATLPVGQIRTWKVNTSLHNWAKC